MKKLILLLILLSTISCSRRAYPVSEKTTQTKDSVIVIRDTIILHDTTFVFKGDSSHIQVLATVDSAGQAELPLTTTESPRLKSSVSITKGIVRVDCICKDLEEKVKLQERRITELTKINDSQKTAITLRVSFIPTWAKVLSGIGAFYLLGTLIFIIIRLHSKFIKI